MPRFAHVLFLDLQGRPFSVNPACVESVQQGDNNGRRTAVIRMAAGNRAFETNNTVAEVTKAMNDAQIALDKE